MIPEFPDFKRLEFSDKEEIDEFTRRYEPYSDFNFTSMWSWDVEQKIVVSRLYDNLVVLFTDYLTKEPFYSFMGINKVQETASQLLALSAESKIQLVLKLIPEITAEMLSRETFLVEERVDHTDYLISVDKLCSYERPELASKRRSVALFQKKHPHLHYECLDLKSPYTTQKIEKLFLQWTKNKGRGEIPEDNPEFVALRRCLESSLSSELIATGIFEEDILAAFWILEDVGNGFAISHFEKADTTSFTGIFPYLKQKTAEELRIRAITYINLEQDLGILGLRANKHSYFPQKHLRKYDVLAKE